MLSLAHNTNSLLRLPDRPLHAYSQTPPDSICLRRRGAIHPWMLTSVDTNRVKKRTTSPGNSCQRYCTFRELKDGSVWNIYVWLVGSFFLFGRGAYCDESKYLQRKYVWLKGRWIMDGCCSRPLLYPFHSHWCPGTCADIVVDWVNRINPSFLFLGVYLLSNMG